MPRDPKPLPSQEELHKLLRYEPSTGALYWRERSPTTKANRIFNKTFVGRPAGYLQKRYGYIIVEIFVVHYKAHRVIWKMMTGTDPREWIDHIDQDRSNNRWENLREATQAQNQYNAKRSPRNTSGFRCVSFIRRFGKYRAAVQVGGERQHIGYFETKAGARAAATDVINKTRGRFARTD